MEILAAIAIAIAIAVGAWLALRTPPPAVTSTATPDPPKKEGPPPVQDEPAPPPQPPPPDATLPIYPDGLRIGVVRDKPKGAWIWHHPGPASALMVEWTAGSAPFNLMKPRPKLRGRPSGKVMKHRGELPADLDGTMTVGDGLSTWLELDGQRLPFPPVERPGLPADPGVSLRREQGGLRLTLAPTGSVSPILLLATASLQRDFGAIAVLEIALQGATDDAIQDAIRSAIRTHTFPKLHTLIARTPVPLADLLERAPSLTHLDIAQEPADETLPSLQAFRGPATWWSTVADLPLQELDLTGALPEPEVLAESAVWATVQTVRATHAIAAARALALAMPPKLESVELFVEPDDVTEVYEGLVIPQGTTVRLTGTRPPVALRQAMLARAPDIRMPAPAEEPDPGEVMTRLEAALAAHVPAVALRPGATDAAIDALEAEIGQKLPESLRAIYRLHDGQGDRDTLPGLFFGMPWLPLEAMTATWREWEGLVDEELHLELSSHPPGAIQLGYARRGWLPISEDFSGNLLAVDLAPGPEGWRGQLINAGRDEHDKHVLARSLPEFLARVCEEIEAGRVHFGEEHLYSTERESRHFLDVVPHVAAQWRGSP